LLVVVAGEKKKVGREPFLRDPQNQLICHFIKIVKVEK